MQKIGASRGAVVLPGGAGFPESPIHFMRLVYACATSTAQLAEAAGRQLSAGIAAWERSAGALSFEEAMGWGARRGKRNETPHARHRAALRNDLIDKIASSFPGQSLRQHADHLSRLGRGEVQDIPGEARRALAAVREAGGGLPRSVDGAARVIKARTGRK